MFTTQVWALHSDLQGPRKAPGAIVSVCNLALGRQRQESTWGLFQVQWETLFPKIMWKMIEEDTLYWPLASIYMHVHIHTNMCNTHTHTQSLQEQELCFSLLGIRAIPSIQKELNKVDLTKAYSSGNLKAGACIMPHTLPEKLSCQIPQS